MVKKEQKVTDLKEKRDITTYAYNSPLSYNNITKESITICSLVK